MHACTELKKNIGCSKVLIPEIIGFSKYITMQRKLVCAMTETSASYYTELCSIFFVACATIYKHLLNAFGTKLLGGSITISFMVHQHTPSECWKILHIELHLHSQWELKLFLGIWHTFRLRSNALFDANFALQMELDGKCTQHMSQILLVQVLYCMSMQWVTITIAIHDLSITIIVKQYIISSRGLGRKWERLSPN